MIQIELKQLQLNIGMILPVSADSYCSLIPIACSEEDEMGSQAGLGQYFPAWILRGVTSEMSWSLLKIKLWGPLLEILS